MGAAHPYLNFPILEALTLPWWDNPGTFFLPRTFGHYSTPSLRSLTIIGPAIPNENDLLELVALFPPVDELVIDGACVSDQRVLNVFLPRSYTVENLVYHFRRR
jgi:hypothetical protein